MMMVSAILNVTLMPSFFAVSARLAISAIMMMVGPSNPYTDLNLDRCLSINIGDTEKHTCNSQNQPDLLFHRYHPVKFVTKDSKFD
jgi:hypothetical protein